MTVRVLPILLAALAWLPQPAPLEARFIGNMAIAISDGAVTVMTDFPYQSGYSRYMTYPADEIRSATPSTLSLITHRHLDHWDPALSDKTGWNVAGPLDVIANVPASRVLPLARGATFGTVQIEPIETPHASIGHYSVRSHLARPPALLQRRHRKRRSPRDFEKSRCRIHLAVAVSIGAQAQPANRRPANRDLSPRGG